MRKLRTLALWVVVAAVVLTVDSKVHGVISQVAVLGALLLAVFLLATTYQFWKQRKTRMPD